MGYDGIGRMTSLKNAAGYQVNYQYENLDRIKEIDFQDSTKIQYTYTCCGVNSIKDRLGRTTLLNYDLGGRANSSHRCLQ